MPGRTRNTKKLAQRIQRDYFKRAFAIPKWCTYLAVIVATAGAGWLAWRALARDATPFSSGPVSAHHASFGQNCTACHVQQTAFKSNVTNEACLVCHDGPVHKEQQTSTPKCIECHVEHNGAQQLLHASGKACTACHTDLKTKDGKVTLPPHIESLEKGHPEFAPLRPGGSDPGGIKFNHKVHLKKDLKAAGRNVQLECTDCHRPNGIVQPWPYGRPDPSATVAKVNFPVSTRAYMQPVNYDEHCASCHPLFFDKRIGEPAPHKKPEIVRQFLEQSLRAYVAAHPEELRQPSATKRIPHAKSAPLPRTSAEWIRTRLAESEHALWTRTCAECHTLNRLTTSAAPKVQDANLTARWLQHGRFDHSPHKMLTCIGCHTRAETSEKTSDVLVPSIKICQTCHSRDAKGASAGAECFECHQYHDWSKEKPRHGTLGVPRV